MKLKIGKVEYTTSRPKGLAEALIASTGCSPGEVARMLGGQPQPNLVARALLPFLPEEGRPEAVALADEIHAHGTAEIAAKVAGLYGTAEPEAAAPDASGGQQQSGDAGKAGK